MQQHRDTDGDTGGQVIVRPLALAARKVRRARWQLACHRLARQAASVGVALGLASTLGTSGVLVMALPSATPAFAQALPQKTVSFSFTGASQSWTVPAGVKSATFDIFGAQGGNGGDPSSGPCNCSGGLGGEVTLTMAVTPGSTLQVNVGGAGGSITPSSQGNWQTGVGGSGGFNGGGNGGYGGPTGGGGGGGASDVRSGSFGLSDRLLVAGGGGGGAGNIGSNGGAGGGLTGVGGTGYFLQGWNATGGGGGTQTAGGTGGANQDEASFPGSFGQGSSAPEGLNGGTFAGGGGGGGYYGGGAGNYLSGGGGGSGYSSAAGAVFHTGVRQGNGQVSITYTPPVITGPPKITSATAGNSQATVAFTPSQSDQNSGNVITSYTVTARVGKGVTSGPATSTASGATSPITVTGLSNGTDYAVTVYASNPAGSGPESAPANVVPVTVPDAPSNVTAISATLAGAATGTVDVVFTPPFNGGLPIQSYTAVSSPGGITVTGPGPSITVTGLTYGTSYTFTGYATNSLGNGPASAPSNAVTAVSVPSPPLVPGAATLDQAGYVSCLPPADDGGTPIVAYTVTSSPGGITASGSSCPILVTGLTDGTPYTFTVTATNAAGGISQPSQPTSKIVPRTASGPQPRNDNFATAQVISGTSGSVSGTNVGATVEPGEPTIQDVRGGASVWYKWVVPATGTYRFDTCTANPAVVGLIGAFTGNSVSSLTEFGPGPSPDSCPTAADGSGQAGSTLTISPIAGQTIYLKFDGVNPGSNANPPYEGPFTLEWAMQ